jgi:hypothetical protein
MLEMETFREFVLGAVVLGCMFALRIGLPLLIMLSIGWGLRKLLEEKQEAPRPSKAEEPEPNILRS